MVRTKRWGTLPQRFFFPSRTYPISRAKINVVTNIPARWSPISIDCLIDVSSSTKRSMESTDSRGTHEYSRVLIRFERDGRSFGKNNMKHVPRNIMVEIANRRLHRIRQFRTVQPNPCFFKYFPDKCIGNIFILFNLPCDGSPAHPLSL